MHGGLSTADWCVIGVYLGLVALIGFYAAGGQRSTRDYFLGGRSLPWWAAALSIIATETSAVTLIGTPRKSYEGDWSFLQFVMGLVLGRVFLALFFIQAFYRNELTTVYGFLERRFGGATRSVAALLFLIGRVVGSAVRLYAGCLALQVATGLPIEQAIVGLGVFGTIYTLAGGIKAVVWTDVLLGVTFMAAGVLSAAYLFTQLPAGMSGLLSSPDLADKLDVFQPVWDLANDHSLLAGLAGGFVLTMATHGTDQDIAQRMLACRDSRSGKLSVIGSAVIILPLMALFLAIGSLLHYFYAAHPPAYKLPSDLNHIFPVFVVQELPMGFRGFVTAGLLAASISSFTSVLNALASTALSDFYTPFRRSLGSEPGESHLLAVSRAATLLWGAVLVVGALGFRGSATNVLDVAYQTLQYFYGALLGAFLLGIFTRRGSSVSVITGMLVSVPAVLVFQLRDYLANPAAAPEIVQGWIQRIPPEMQQRVLARVPDLAYPYWVIVGTAVTLVIGALGSRGLVSQD